MSNLARGYLLESLKNHVHQSISTRNSCQQQVLKQFQNGDCLVAINGRKLLQETLKGIPLLQMIEHSLNRYSRSHEDRRAAHDFRIAVDQLGYVMRVKHI